MKLDFEPEDITYPLGLEISVDGFMGDGSSLKPSQVYMEVYEGKLRVHVWSQSAHDAEVSVDIRPLPLQPRSRRAPCLQSGRQKLQSVVLTLQYCLETFEQNCQCGRCDPCTRGRKDIEKAIRDIEDTMRSQQNSVSPT